MVKGCDKHMTIWPFTRAVINYKMCETRINMTETFWSWMLGRNSLSRSKQPHLLFCFSSFLSTFTSQIWRKPFTAYQFFWPISTKPYVIICQGIFAKDVGGLLEKKKGTTTELSQRVLKPLLNSCQRSCKLGPVTQSTTNGALIPRLVAKFLVTLCSIPSMGCVEGILSQTLYIHTAISKIICKKITKLHVRKQRSYLCTKLLWQSPEEEAEFNLNQKIHEIIRVNTKIK